MFDIVYWAAVAICACAFASSLLLLGGLVLALVDWLTATPKQPAKPVTWPLKYNR